MQLLKKNPITLSLRQKVILKYKNLLKIKLRNLKISSICLSLKQKGSLKYRNLKNINIGFYPCNLLKEFVLNLKIILVRFSDAVLKKNEKVSLVILFYFFSVVLNFFIFSIFSICFLDYLNYNLLIQDLENQLLTLNTQIGTIENKLFKIFEMQEGNANLLLKKEILFDQYNNKANYSWILYSLGFMCLWGIKFCLCHSPEVFVTLDPQVALEVLKTFLSSTDLNSLDSSNIDLINTNIKEIKVDFIKVLDIQSDSLKTTDSAEILEAFEKLNNFFLID